MAFNIGDKFINTLNNAVCEIQAKGGKWQLFSVIPDPLAAKPGAMMKVTIEVTELDLINFVKGGLLKYIEPEFMIGDKLTNTTNGVEGKIMRTENTDYVVGYSVPGIFATIAGAKTEYLEEHISLKHLRAAVDDGVVKLVRKKQQNNTEVVNKPAEILDMQQKYNVWRNAAVMYDSALLEARVSFSNYAGLGYTIAKEIMDKLESEYLARLKDAQNKELIDNCINPPGPELVREIKKGDLITPGNAYCPTCKRDLMFLGSKDLAAAHCCGVEYVIEHTKEPNFYRVTELNKGIINVIKQGGKDDESINEHF